MKLFGVICLVLIIVAGCNNSQGKTSEQSTGGTTELAVSYSTVGEMLDDAELIIEGNVLSQKTIVHGDMPFTISQVKVKSTLLGEATDEIISVIETGGIFKPEGKPGDDLPKAEFKLNGVDTLKPDEHIVLFLTYFEGPQVDNAFIPIGAYQGKFVVKEGKKSTQATDTENKLSPQEMNSINSIENLRDRVEQ